MRTLGFLLALVSAIVIEGPRNRPNNPNYEERPTVTATAVPLQAGDPTRDRVGALRYLGGWRLQSTSPQWSGLSALHVDRDRFTAIGDAGTVVRFRMAPDGRVTEARVASLPAGCAQTDNSRTRDAESLSGDGAHWWVSYESRHRICRLSRNFSQAEALRTPPLMRNWRKAWGAEAMLRLSDGRTLVFAEGAPQGASTHPLLIFAGDPTDPRTPVRTLGYRPLQGYSPVDAAELPDGRVLVLHRRFTPWGLFRTTLAIVDRSAFEKTTVTGRVIARLEPPLVSDNFEGLAIARDGVRTIVWLVSDNNSMIWQRTYLLKFALDLPAVRRLPPSSPSQSYASGAAP